MAFDAKNGEEIWRHKLPQPVYLMDWGTPIESARESFQILKEDQKELLFFLDDSRRK